MKDIYLIVDTGKEDYYELVGTREDLDALSKGDVVYVSYPGSDKTVGITFRESKDPENDIKDLIKSNKITNAIKTIVFIMVTILTVYGGTTLIQQIKSGL